MARLMEMVSGGARIPDRWQPQSSWSCSLLRCRAYTCPMLTEMLADDGRTEHLHALYNDDGRGCHVLCSRSMQLPELKICSETIVLCQQQWTPPARTQETCSCERKKSPMSVFKLRTNCNCDSKVREEI